MLEKVKINKISKGASETVEDLVISEVPLTIFINDVELITLLCTPDKLDYLAVGFLYSEGFVKTEEDIALMSLDRKSNIFRLKTREPMEFEKSEIFGRRIITSGCGKGATFFDYRDFSQCRKIENKVEFKSEKILDLMKDFQQRSELFKKTGGVHAAALCAPSKIVLFSEDLGRHNAIDKIFGEAFLSDISLEDKIILTTGRISSEILIKVAKRGIPAVVSRSAPTDLAVKLAKELGIRLIGFARGERMSIYSK
jgi:FdhD protein